MISLLPILWILQKMPALTVWVSPLYRQMNNSRQNTGIFASRGAWLILAAAMLWGTTGTSQALAPDGSSPAAIGALRLLIGGSALAVYAFLRGGLKLRSWPIILPLVAGGCIALYQISFFWAVAKTGVAVGTIVAIGSSPVFAGILEYLMRKKRPDRRWYLSTVIAISGCLMLLMQSGDLRLDGMGILLALVRWKTVKCCFVRHRFGGGNCLVQPDERSPRMAALHVLHGK